MKRFKLSCIVLMTGFILGSCSGPKKSVEEENVLTSLSNIQQSLENDISYEQFIELLPEFCTQIPLSEVRGQVAAIDLVR